MKKLIDKHWGILAIFVLWLILIIANFAFGTWLSGWDNLHPEFNFTVNLKRALFASWQEYQGFGLLGGMGHASDLFRQIILWVSSLVLPLNFLRYFFHFSMLLVGALGIYFLLKDFVLEKYGESARKWGSLGGAIFYLFNLGTLQMFYLPFEVFSTHFGFLPWLFWGVFRYLKEPSKKNISIFILINVLSMSQGYVATVFLVYVTALVIVLVSSVIPDLIRNLHRFQTPLRGSGMTRRIITVLLVTFCVNAFWLLPNLYFVLTVSGTNTGAKINLMSTENNLLLNKKYGGLRDVMLLKGFWFDNVEVQSNGVTDYIMGDWVGHLKNPLVLTLGYLLFGLSVLGIIFAIKTKNKKALLFLPMFLLSFTFLANDTFGFSFIDKLLYKLPLMSQVFRFPFTKFSILMAFCEAVFYGMCTAFFIDKCHSSESWNLHKLFYRFRIKSGMTYLLVFVFLALPIIFMFPVFQRKLFYFKEKVKIPQEYFQVFDFFKTQDKNTRIANFPQPTYWGWTNYQWNSQLYSGSGFLWYGIEQPILDRAFDVWSAQNENYYWEISYALYSRNRELFEKVLEKYQVNWLIVDGNVINPGSSKALFYDELETIIGGQKTEDGRQITEDGGQNDRFELVKTFGKIKIYKVNLETPVRDFVWVGENLPVVNNYVWGNEDKAYKNFGTYVIPAKAGIYKNNENYIDSGSKAGMTENYDIYYPFRTLFTGRTSEDLNFTIEDKGDHFIFRKKLPDLVANYTLEVPDIGNEKFAMTNSTDSAVLQYFVPTVDISKSKSKSKSGTMEWEITVNIPKVSNLTTVIDPFYVPSISKAENCNQFSNGEVRMTRLRQGFDGQGSEEKPVVRLEAVDATNCSAAFYLPELLHKYGYLISVESKNISGKSLLFWVENLTNRKADQELYLNATAGSSRSLLAGSRRDLMKTTWLIQPPMAEDGLGYTLHFDNVSIGREKTVNELGKITLNPIPYEYLMGIKLVKQGVIPAKAGNYTSNEEGLDRFQVKPGMTGIITVKHPNPSVYEVTMTSEGILRLPLDKLGVAQDDKVTLVLSQAYHEGWKAYEVSGIKYQVFREVLAPIFGEEIKEHVIVNNWGNGWNLNSKLNILNSKTTIILIFWPQYLEYAGFVILIGAGIVIFLYNSHH